VSNIAQTQMPGENLIVAITGYVPWMKASVTERLLALPPVPVGEKNMSTQHHARIALKLVPTDDYGHSASAPPILIASTHTIDFTCGKCGIVLMHAEEGQVRNLVIHCTECGSFNSTDG
jgi:hypothetical protein